MRCVIAEREDVHHEQCVEGAVALVISTVEA
jgi:hypothetical protein